MQFIAFEGTRQIALGSLPEVTCAAKLVVDQEGWLPVLIFDAATSQVVDLDFRAEPPAEEPPRGPGRPKLGVVAREVTLLPRHWEWLQAQPGGASVALRRLVEEARRVNESKDRVRQARESVYRFIQAMAGDEAGFEEATRALFAGNREGFETKIAGWPCDVREHTSRLAAEAF